MLPLGQVVGVQTGGSDASYTPEGLGGLSQNRMTYLRHPSLLSRLSRLRGGLRDGDGVGRSVDFLKGGGRDGLGSPQLS